MRPGLYALRPVDVAKASAVLFEAFLDDPFFEYMLGTRRSDERLVRSFHAFTINLGIRYGEVYAPTETLEGVAVWLRPGRTEMTAWKSLVSGIPGIGVIRSLGWKGALTLARRMAAYASYSDGLHKTLVPDRHWYLLSIGIGVQYRGKGYASKLLRPMLERCDSDRLPCYLETHNESNVGLYGHYGFVAGAEGVLPGSARRHWAMVRNPRGSRPGER